MKSLEAFNFGTKHGEYKASALWLAILGVGRISPDPWWATALWLIAAGVCAHWSVKVEDRFLDASIARDPHDD